MFPSNKTTVNLDVDWAALEKHAWEKFRPRFDAIRTVEDVRALLAEAPPLGSPSSRYYSNLAEFLLMFRAPADAGADERFLYAQSVERLDVAGALGAGIASASLATLRCPEDRPTDE